LAQAAAGQNHEGHIIRMISQIHSRFSLNMGEALAAHLAISLASSLHRKLFILEGDSQVIILALQQPNISRIGVYLILFIILF
jgi:hypothetical protein